MDEREFVMLPRACGRGRQQFGLAWILVFAVVAMPGRHQPAAAFMEGLAALKLHRIFYINLERRPLRRKRFEERAEVLGLKNFLSRFPAVDGSKVDLARYPSSVVPHDGLRRAAEPPEVVNGVQLTRGALGLILSYHTLLQRIASDDQDHLYVVAEDDAVFNKDFVERLQHCVKALESEDPRWDFLHLGYYDDDCSLAPLEGAGSRFLCRPIQVYGLFGAALKAQGARKLLEHLFPLDEQIDSSLASVYGTLRAYAARSSLMTAPHSTPENSDIQILPEGFRWRG